MNTFQTEFDKYFEGASEILRKTGSADQTFEYVDAIPDADYRNGTLEKVARLLASQGNAREALRFCRAIHSPLEYADALFEVGRELRKASSLDSAKSIFRQAVEATEQLNPRAWEKPAIFLQVSDELWNLGEKNEASELLHRAIELAKQPPQHFESSKTLAGCARILARWGNPQQAIQVAQAIESPEHRNTVLGEVQKPSAGG